MHVTLHPGVSEIRLMYASDVSSKLFLKERCHMLIQRISRFGFRPVDFFDLPQNGFRPVDF